MIAALVMAGALATFHSTRTQAVSGTTLGTLISGNGSTVDLLILWRGSPGWLGKGGGGGSGGGSGSSMSGSIEYGDVALDYEMDFSSRIVQIAGKRVDMAANNVLLVDEVDSKTGPRLAKQMTVVADVSEDISSIVRRSPELVAYVQCEARMPDAMLQTAADVLCGSITGHVSAAAGQMELRMALAAYAQSVRTMDHARTAALFADDGELVIPGRQPIRGPEAIETFLQTFSDSRVVAYQIGPDTTTVVDGDTGTQRGTYHQRVASPDGHVTDASGSFTISWVFVDGRWRIKRMETHSNQ